VCSCVHSDASRFRVNLRPQSRAICAFKVIDDEERNGGKQFHLFFASSIERRIGRVIAEGVGFTIEDAITLLNGGLAIAWARWLLPVPGEAEEQGVFMFGDEVGGGEIEDKTPIHLLIEVEVEVVESFLRTRNSAFFLRRSKSDPAALQFIGNQTRDQIDRAMRSVLSLMKTGFQHGGDAAKAELFKVR